MGSYIKPPNTVPATTALAVASLAVAAAAMQAGDVAAINGTTRVYGNLILGTDTASNSAQNAYLLGRAYASPTTTPYLMARLAATSVGTATLHIGGTSAYTAPGNVLAYGAGALKLWLGSAGVALGISPPNPASNQAVGFYTTVHGTTPSAYFDNTTGTLRSAWDGASGNPNYSAGSGHIGQFYATSTSTYFRHSSTGGSCNLDSAASIVIKSATATSLSAYGAIRLIINGAAGINVPEATADPTVDLQWVYRSDTHEFCIRSGGTVRRVALT